MDISDAVMNFDYDGEDFEIVMNNGTKLIGQLWRPESQPKLIVVYVHGLGGFVTQKHDVFDVLLENKAIVLACDHYTHGRSPGPRVSCVIQDIVEETIMVIKKAKELYPALPLFVWGHSMGSLATMDMVLRNPAVSQSVNGIICESPWISSPPSRESREISLIESVLIKIGSVVCPNLLIDPQMNYFSDDMPQKFIDLTMSSPFNAPYVTPRLMDSCLSEITYVRSHSSNWPQDLPLIFLQGMKDELVSAVHSVAFFQDLSKMFPQISYKAYENGCHFLFKGLSRKAAISDMLCFMNKYSQ